MITSQDLVLSRKPESTLDLDSPDLKSKNQQILQLQQMVMALQAQVNNDSEVSTLVAHQQTELQATALKAYKAVEENNKLLQEAYKKISQEKDALAAEVSQLKTRLASQTSAAAKVKAAAETLATKQAAEINRLRAEITRLRSNESLYETGLRKEESEWNQSLVNLERASLTPETKRITRQLYTQKLQEIDELRSNLSKR